MKYDLSNPLHRAQFKARAAKLLGDAKAVAELRECRPPRSMRQNSYLHAALGYFASQTGYSLEYAKQEYYKRLCNRDIFEREVNDRFLGRICVLRSSASLTTEEMTLSIERFRNWAAEAAGVYIPSPDEAQLVQLMEIEAERHRQYL